MAPFTMGLTDLFERLIPCPCVCVTLCKAPMIFFSKQHCEFATADILMLILLAKLFCSLGEAAILILLVLCASLQRNRIIEWVGLEGTCYGQGHLQLDQVAQSPVQPDPEHFPGLASTASLGNLFQCLTTCIIKNLFHTYNPNLPSFTLKLFPLVLLLQTLVKSLFCLSYKSPLYSRLNMEAKIPSRNFRKVLILFFSKEIIEKLGLLQCTEP